MRLPQGKPTAGELCRKADADNSQYDAREVAESMCEGVEEQVAECVNRHKDRFDEPFFFVVMVLGRDNVLCNVIRRKFYATPFLPQPSPNQTVWVYRKRPATAEMVWCLPTPEAMAVISESALPPQGLSLLKEQCDAFFNGTFFDYVRKVNNEPEWLTEHEFLEVHRPKLTKALQDKVAKLGPDAGYVFDGDGKQVANAPETLCNKNVLNASGKAKNSKRNIIT